MYTHLMHISKVYLKVEYKSQYYHLLFIKVLKIWAVLSGTENEIKIQWSKFPNFISTVQTMRTAVKIITSKC